ncbi:hypothetical protein Q1W73_14440 [Asticcacaulis sp. ZE23SCel15]|uniref:hypothetical protein n=1 Tax=Asticcacaulis sp. ZE23SCel15 TaxID=3059027 RepID=UPI00265F5EE8|nr:hypothetical protein [Asticcacaulis sp. ZE23SCel15]WKL56851.1 hypothetical protein Q1W73_14440 [Asticcacaulis sp. ZE23SCel15]
MRKELSEEIAFDGLRLLRDRPLTAMKWLLVMFVGYGVAYGFTVLAFAEHWLAFWQALRNEPQLLSGLIYTTLMAVSVCGILVGLTHLIVKCAIYRAQIAIENPRAATLSLGPDEVRLVAFYILKFLLIMVLSVSLFLVVAGLAWLANTALEVHIGRNFATYGIIMLALLLQALGVVWLKLRLSLASMDTFCQRRINFIGSFLLTRRYIWSILVVYIFTYALVLICVTSVHAISAIGLNMSLIEQFKFLKQGLEVKTLFDLKPFLPFFIVVLTVTAISAFLRELMIAAAQSRLFLTLRERAREARPKPEVSLH